MPKKLALKTLGLSTVFFLLFAIAPPHFVRAEVVGGDGESRLWFPHTRVISALSSWAQTVFNPIQPFEEDEMPTDSVFDHYFYTAFSKNATPEEIELVLSSPNLPIGFEAEGAITTRITRHQGIHDTVDVINDEDNNSSVIVGTSGPDPLFSFGSTGDDNIYNDNPACFIPQDRNNPGDDLLGPIQTAEMMFTGVVTYEAHRAPFTDDDDPFNDCVFEGEFDSNVPFWQWNNQPPGVPDELTYCDLNCCSGQCDLNPLGGCIPYDDVPDPEGTIVECGDVGTIYEDYPEYCNPGVPGEFPYCCFLEDQCLTQTVSGVCGELPDVPLEVGEGESQVFDKTPMVEYIYQTTLEAEDSIWRRFMPGIVYEFEDIPASSIFSATAQVDSPRTSGTIIDVANGQTASPRIYFPKLGTLHRYWLQEFQKAIRPEGFGFEVGLPEGECPGAPTVTDDQIGPWIAGKENFILKADQWTGGGGCSLAEACYNYVVKSSLDSGVNPAFTLAIWLHESAASDYCSNPGVDDLGTNTGGSQNIVGQVETFLPLVDAFKSCLSSYPVGTGGWLEPMHAFMARFKSTDPSTNWCDPGDPDGVKFFENMIFPWVLVNEGFGASCTTSNSYGDGYAISWPDDMSCPNP